MLSDKWTRAALSLAMHVAWEVTAPGMTLSQVSREWVKKGILQADSHHLICFLALKLSVFFLRS
jgi:hypothetical protein